jgi:hypothetical protein
MFVTVDGEEIARNVFRRAQYSISSDDKEWKVMEVINISDNNILREIFHKKL